jgi:transglutaminase-like putative cysteine protease
MRLRIRHRLHITFPDLTRNVIGVLRLTPRSYEGQRIADWRIDIGPDCLMRRTEDHFGNFIHTLNVSGVTSGLSIVAQGELTSFDVAGVVRGSAERLPVELFHRDTIMTMPDDSLRSFAEQGASGAESDLGRLHNLMAAVHDRVGVDASGSPASSAIEVLKAGTADSAGHAQLFTACARHLGFPARCASGYYVSEGEPAYRHHWAEAYVTGLGWTGFDTVHHICPQDDHVRVAIGLDAVDASPVRVKPGGTLEETVEASWLFGRGSSQAQKNGA